MDQKTLMEDGAALMRNATSWGLTLGQKMDGEAYNYNTNMKDSTFATRWAQKDRNARSAVTLAAMARRAGYSRDQFPMLCMAACLTFNTLRQATWAQVEASLFDALDKTVKAEPLTDAEMTLNSFGSYGFLGGSDSVMAALRIERTSRTSGRDVWVDLYEAVPDKGAFPFNIHWANVYKFRPLAVRLLTAEAMA